MVRRIHPVLPLFLLVTLLASCGPTATQSPPPEVTPAAPTGAPTAAPTAASTAIPTAVPTGAPTPGGGEAPTAAPVGTVVPPPPPPPAQFAAYVEEPVQVVPAVSQEPIAADLSNVNSAFLFSPQQREHLAQDGFVVSPSEEKEFYMLYEKARYNFEPIFVTSDSLLHVYHLLFDKLLRTLEVEQFIPTLKELNARMLANAEGQYEQLRGTSLEEHARRNVAFFAVASRLLDSEVEIPAYAQDLAEAELALIEAHSGFFKSPLFPALKYGEDYTQYIPRGHYTQSPELEQYFRAMMWYGRMTFRIIKPADPNGREETLRALLVVQALASDAEAVALWNRIYEPTVFFVGRSDDLLYTEYAEAMAQVYGGIPTDPAAFADEDRLTQFMEIAQTMRPPRILGIVVDITQDEEETTKGFRFMGQRFIPDSYVLGLLIDDKVPDRFPPKGLDVLAVMGSERAYALLEAAGDTAYPNYVENLTKLKEEFAGFTQEDWTQNLYWSWLYMFFPLLEKPGAGYPTFMQSPAWLDKNLNSVLGSWAELRHDTILYAKQAYAELGGGGKGPPPEPVPPKGYVEPVPEFYARLAALAAMTRQGLAERGLDMSEQVYFVLETMQTLEDLSLSFKTMAEKELVGEPLTEEEYASIRYYGGVLENFTFAAADSEAPGGTPSTEEEPQAAVIADVATHPGLAAVLEVGVGRIFDLYAIVPIEGNLVVAKGGVFSYYEFSWAMDDRLTDEKWREMLDNGEAPPLPDWTASFRVDATDELALRNAVWNFNAQLIDALWWPNPDFLNSAATGEALDVNKAYAQSLLDQRLYEGYQLIRLDYLSLDRQDATHAVVTTRETWSVERYQMGEYEDEPGTLIARRPEHTLGVVYNLERVDEEWLVSRVEVQGQVPEWESVGP